MNSREKILNAAIFIFAKKGRYGAHMEEIAACAHINKAMIYYIFHSKDELYLEVLKFLFEKAWESLTPFVEEFINKGKNYAEVLSDYITVQLTFFNENPNYTKILVEAMSNGAEEIPLAVNYIKDAHKDTEHLNDQIKKFIEKGKADQVFRDIDTDQLLISMMGMIIIYFLSHPITESFDIEVKDEASFMESRRRSIIDLVLHGIMT